MKVKDLKKQLRNKEAEVMYLTARLAIAKEKNMKDEDTFTSLFEAGFTMKDFDLLGRDVRDRAKKAMLNSISKERLQEIIESLVEELACAATQEYIRFLPDMLGLSDSEASAIGLG